MSKDELGKLTVIQGAVEGVNTVKEAARPLHLSCFICRSLKKQFRKQGEGAVIRVSYATLCRMLKGVGIASKRKDQDGGKRFSRRKRRSRYFLRQHQETSQLDGGGIAGGPSAGQNSVRRYR